MVHPADPQWISEVLHFCPNLPIVLVGCKIDLRNDPKTIQDLARMNQRPVTREDGQHVAQKIHAADYVECSAKTGDGVRKVFETATRFALSVSGAGGVYADISLVAGGTRSPRGVLCSKSQSYCS